MALTVTGCDITLMTSVLEGEHKAFYTVDSIEEHLFSRVANSAVFPPSWASLRENLACGF